MGLSRLERARYRWLVGRYRLTILEFVRTLIVVPYNRVYATIVREAGLLHAPSRPRAAEDPLVWYLTNICIMMIGAYAFEVDVARDR